MRRLWSHIILAATSLLMVGATFAGVVRNIDSNIEFSAGREYVFRVYDKDEDGKAAKDEEHKFNDQTAVKEIAEVMEERLQIAEVSRYEIDIQGNDTIKVSFVQNDSEYSFLQNYLTFDATLAISNSKDEYALGESFLNSNKKAYLKTSESGYPTIVIPINYDDSDFQTLYLTAKEMADNGEGEVEEEVEGEDGEETHVHHAYLYLWYNYVPDYYTYEAYSASDSTISSKVLMTFDASDPFLNDDKTELRAYVNPASSDDTVTAASLAQAYRTARYYINLLNAKKLNYSVECLFSTEADLWVESLVNLGDSVSTVALSRTFIATLTAIVVVSLLLVYFYRLGALSIATTSIVSTFIGLLFITLLGAEFNFAVIVGLLALAFVSITSGVIYCNKLKEECYRGRSLKKANSEAAKKAVLPTVDLHVVLVAVGVAAYLLGGILMKGFAIVTILGGLVSLVVSLAGLRGLLWLATNEQGLANRYDLFDVSPDQVPNALDEEKQKYYGPSADKDYTKGKKPVAIVALTMLVASVACLVTFGVMYNGAVYGTSSPYGNSQIYVEYYSNESEDTSLNLKTTDQIKTLLENSYLKTDDNPANDKQLKTIVVGDYSEPFTRTFVADDDKTATLYYTYYRIDLNSSLKEDSQFVYKDENGANKGDYKTANDYFETLNETSGADLGLDKSVTVSFKTSERVNADQPAFTSLILATAVGGAIASAYLLLRYRLSRGLAALGIATLNVGISAGLFSMLRFVVPATSYVSVALPFLAVFSLAIAIIFMNKEREMILEDRTRDNSVEVRGEKMKKAMALASTPIIIAFIIALYMGVNFYGFIDKEDASWMFLLIILGVSISTGLTLVLFGPLAHLLFKWFSNVQIVKPKASKKKKTPVRVKKSAEPEEAIFIGIND